VVERGSSPGGYLATSVDQLVTLLLAKYAGEVVKALPRDKAYSPRGWENIRRARLTLSVGADFGFWHKADVTVAPTDVRC
jgi:hypothetical protein